MTTRPEWERLTRRLMRLGVFVELRGEGHRYAVSTYTNDAASLFGALADVLRDAESAEDTTRAFALTAAWSGDARVLATFRLVRRRLTPTGALELVWHVTEGGADT